MLDPEHLLNHGTVGVTPRRVLAEKQALRDEMERRRRGSCCGNWAGISRCPGGPRPRCASQRSRAAFLGARPDDLVFVPSHDRHERGPRIAAARPGRRGGDHRSGLRRDRLAASGVCDAPARPFGRSTSNTRSLAAADAWNRSSLRSHHTRARRHRPRHRSKPRWCSRAAIAAECHARGVPGGGRGAVPGSRPLDIPSLGVDWLCRKPSQVGARATRLRDLWAGAGEASILTTPSCLGPRPGLPRRFEHTATADPTSYLAAPEGMALLREWDFAPVCSTCTASPGRRPASDRLLAHDTRDPARDGRRDGHGAAAARSGDDDAEAARLRLRSSRGSHRSATPRLARRLWTRVSAQIYNDRSDIAKLARRWPADGSCCDISLRL